MLHIVASKLDDCLRTAQTGDVILLIEDAIYYAEKASTQTQELTIYILMEDVVARGWQSKIAGLTPVDYAGFVQLTAQHHPVMNW